MSEIDNILPLAVLGVGALAIIFLNRPIANTLDTGTKIIEEQIEQIRKDTEQTKKDLRQAEQGVVGIFDPRTSKPGGETLDLSKIGIYRSLDVQKLNNADEIKMGLGGVCQRTSDCANNFIAVPRSENYGLNNLVCCEKNRCVPKLKDWAEIYWCPGDNIADRIGHAMSQEEKNRRVQEKINSVRNSI